jgi:hypothetical protein
MSCLFIAMGARLGLNANRVRKEICCYLQHQSDLKVEGLDLKDWITISEDTDIDSYVREMQNPSTWGGFFEILAACYLYKIIINIRFGQQFITCDVGEFKDSITLDYNGSHFW